MRNLTGRALYLVAGALLGFAVATAVMGRRLDAVLANTRNAVYSSLVRGCVEGRYLYKDKCDALAKRFFQDYEDITKE